MPSDKAELKKISDEILASTIPLKNLKLSEELPASCLGVASVTRATDLDFLKVVWELDVETASNRACSLLTQVNIVVVSENDFDVEY